MLAQAGPAVIASFFFSFAVDILVGLTGLMPSCLRRGTGGDRDGGGGLPTLNCHHQKDICIKVDSSESHFNVWLFVRGEVIRQCPQTTIFEEKGKPKQNQTEIILLTSLTPYHRAKPAHIAVDTLMSNPIINIMHSKFGR